ncbi:MAG: winged helix-turn-helix transcriptional regulator [Ruminococcus sp.]|nr:winged helix-turn-helix transcriptional regulator [Ruminococcus sp.]
MSVSKILSALSDNNSSRLLEILKKGKISSGDLAKELDMTPQALSYHLSKLKKADLIYETKHKNFIYYELNLTVLDEALMWIVNLRGENDDKN